MHHGPYSTKNSEYKNDCSCPIQSHILFISYPSWQSKKSVSKQHKSETSFASFVEIRRNFSVLKHFFDLTRMQTVLAFMAVETKANILWYSIHILEQNQTIAEPPGDKHFSSILFPSTCQSVYWECLTSIFNFFSSQPRYSFKTSIIMGKKCVCKRYAFIGNISFTKPSILAIPVYWTI